MHHTTFILAFVGAITGSITFLLKIIEYCKCRTRLVIGIALASVSSEKFPKPYFSLDIIFTNRGRRQIVLTDGFIELPPSESPLPDEKKPSDKFELNLAKTTNHLGMAIDSHKRQLLHFEPFDASVLRNCNTKTRAIFKDTNGCEYKAVLTLPSKDHIIQMSDTCISFKNKQPVDMENPFLHPR